MDFPKVIIIIFTCILLSYCIDVFLFLFKIKDVKLNYVKDRDYSKIIVASIGNQLTRLTVIGEISVHDLQNSTQLEELFITGIELPKESEKDHQFEATSFLPNLKKFRSLQCLGIYSYLFEEKKSLTHLQLACSHISTKSSRLNWIEIANIWQDLQELTIFLTGNLTLAQVAVLVPRLKKLKSLTVSFDICKINEERLQVKNLIANWKKEPFNIYFKMINYVPSPCLMSI